MDITQLEHLLALMEKYRLEELEWQSEGEAIRLKKQSGAERGGNVSSLLQTGADLTASATGFAADMVRAEAAAGQGEVVQSQAQSGPGEGLIEITADMIGTFYSAPSPEAPAFVAVGDVVEKGAVLCVLEAMKLMNEVEAPYKLKIESIEVKNGRVVEYGQTLFKVREVQ